ncbi:cysteine methyltransferase [Prauserella marina]|uniref:Methylated-DNA--protein-cysteine methyltransferase n=1 Tax=Prauserella marina TaxID=530584 RepID=A0A222VQ99_9PSEU|nr:cysteine methyltransferase [Prauserella marina]PWV76817.1 methylated-DNA-[protein]-cysteine S-methyltransferase [Prauserella marina]SDC98246.1 methylated-DNA-[protein]-cysteine S-methyltransferase [Prauserella marina]
MHTVVDSPLGPLTLVGDDDLAGGVALTGLYLERQLYRPGEEAFGERAAEPFAGMIEQLSAYFAGRLTEFDVPTALSGTPFQRQVWEMLREIPYGETVTYGWLARRMGKPAAARAVGLANGKNPVSIIVPCHRVVGANGDLTGYGGGVERKRHLLALERSTAARLQPCESRAQDAEIRTQGGESRAADVEIRTQPREIRTRAGG